MAAGAEAPTSSEYIVHHLQHLQSVKQGFIIDMSVFNWDTIFWSVAMGVLTLVVLLKAASKASSGVPGRFQAAVEILVEMVESQSKGIIPHGDRSFIAPLALTVFVWVLFMNSLDFLPVDLPHYIFAWTGLDHYIHYHRIVPTADLNGTIGMSLGVLVLMLYYNVKIKGAGGFVHELFCAPFGGHPALWIPNFALNLIEFAAKTVSLGMRLFGNMFAGELIFLLIALMGGAWSLSATGIGLAIGHIIAGTAWAIFHLIIITLQAFVFMMLTLVYIGQAHDSH